MGHPRPRRRPPPRLERGKSGTQAEQAKLRWVALAKVITNLAAS
jgi:hypothetical protein